MILTKNLLKIMSEIRGICRKNVEFLVIIYILEIGGGDEGHEAKKYSK